MLDKKILPLFNFALGSKLLHFEPVELKFDLNETEKVVGNIQVLNYTRTTSIKFFTNSDITRTFNNNIPAALGDYTDADITIVDRNNQIIVKNLPISTLQFDNNALKFLALDLPFVEVDWTRTKIRRYNNNAPVVFYFGVFYIKNSEFENLIK